MIQSEKEAGLPTWSAPECPFTIEYSPRTLDDIRLGVVEAFFSVPRGGAETGGVLYGHWDGERLAIEDFAALQCEHAFGPSFALSPHDRERLAEMLGAPGPYGLPPVGWYHSHTRSEIFLSDADQEIHRTFFPEPWQVALVLKPHTSQPTRAGFFFRSTDGEVHGKASYHEFVLAPPAVTAGQAEAHTSAEPHAANGRAPAPTEPRAELPRGATESKPRAHAPLPLPRFLELGRPRSQRWLKIAIALLAGAALGAGAYLLRDTWLPPILAMAPRPAAAPPPLGLYTIDSEGQLQIYWSRDSAAVQRASAGVIKINSGTSAPSEIPLDKAHLLSGVFTLARQTERVDVNLGVTQPDGRSGYRGDDIHRQTSGTETRGRSRRAGAARQSGETDGPHTGGSQCDDRARFDLETIGGSTWQTASRATAKPRAQIITGNTSGFRKRPKPKCLSRKNPERSKF